MRAGQGRVSLRFCCLSTQQRCTKVRRALTSSGIAWATRTWTFSCATVKSLTRALAFMESMADPLLLLRFALCLFWHSEHGHLERADEIFRQLFSKFASFCDKDRVSLLFLHFQVLHRLKMFAEASECVDKIIALMSTTPASGFVDANTTPQSRSKSKEDEVSAVLPVYELGDYWMIKMQCQQAAGDYMQATATFSRVVGIKGFVQDGSLTDEQYLELWLGIADKCFYLEDYALATEYYPVALNFAKESQLLASMHYKLGLCFQALGDGQRCVAEYKRARNMNRHVRPPVSLIELRGSYDAQFAVLLEKSVRQIIEEVQVNLYDRAVRQLQRVFRLKRRVPASGDGADSPTEVKMPSIISRKLSRPASRSRPVSSSPHALESANTPGANAAVAGVVVDAAEPVMLLEETEVGIAARRQAEFEARKLDALDQMKKLREAAFNDVHPPGLSSNMTHAARGTSQSELLSPEKDRPEVRRLRSMATFNHVRTCMNANGVLVLSG
jgi:tetratricopeptide (TPR) repeat protein